MKQELTLLIRLLTRWLVSLALLTMAVFSLSLAPFIWRGVELWRPVFADPALAAQVFLHLAYILTPPGVELVVVSPTAAFAAQVQIAFWLALLISLPFLVWSMLQYLRPALDRAEQRWVSLTLLALVALCYLGVYFSYAIVSPYTIYILYTFVTPLAVTPLLGVSELIATFVALTLTTAIAFTIPVGMVLLTRLGVISAQWWRAHARYALIGFLVVSAIITPDGTGVSMLLLSAPVSVLYGLGLVVSARVERVNHLHDHN